MRATSGILACACLLLAVASVSAKVRTVKRIEGIEPGTRVRIEGVPSLRGSTPFTILVLEVADDEVITLKPHTPDIHRQLRNLDGVRVVVEGEVIPSLDTGLPRLEVDAYDVLAPKGAGDPVTGVITVEDDACVLTTREGRRYWITGELAPALCQHDGARVWMVGKKTKRAEGKPPAGSTPFTPSGYGVIDHAP